MQVPNPFHPTLYASRWWWLFGATVKVGDTSDVKRFRNALSKNMGLAPVSVTPPAGAVVFALLPQIIPACSYSVLIRSPREPTVPNTTYLNRA